MTLYSKQTLSTQLEWRIKSLIRHLIGSSRKGPRIFGVGAAKTGTHSLGEMFNDQIKSHHELDIELLIYMHLDRVRTGNDKIIRRFLLRRGMVRDLKIDASHINIYLIDDFEELFPESLYVLTIRHPLDWLRSFIDDSLRAEASDAFKVFREYRFGSNYGHTREEKALADRGLFTLQGYLKYWCFAIEEVTNKIPNDRLFILRTDELGEKSDEIAHFCGIKSDPIDKSRAKSYVNTKRFNVLSEIPKEYLDNIIEAECGHLLQRFF